MNYWYLNIYVLWMNTILNIVLPIISLVVLNILVSNNAEIIVKFCSQLVFAFVFAFVFVFVFDFVFVFVFVFAYAFVLVMFR